MITCLEMALFSMLFLFAYPIGPYTAKGHITGLLHGSGPTNHPGYVGGPLGLSALFEALNIFDLIKAMMVAPMRLGKGRAMTMKEQASAADEGPKNKAYGG